ncbi:polysaccharide biosynthesis tyrosine autokinase [Caldimonas sp. KR1-144]|uniref:polysaccharide biosynthesis tyrosine autokinase n=1 Tax=Caldimonas sp. KR1-144 TaxID=3400911 RepID=UPI003BFB466C
MARFRNSTLHDQDDSAVVSDARELTPRGPSGLIGEILVGLGRMTSEDVERVLQHQRDKGGRFGEIAVSLELVTQDDVLFALSQQFQYPYAPRERRNLSPELIALNQPFSFQAEALRAIRSQVLQRLFSDPGEARRAVAVVSADPGDGKTYFAANLAVMLAQLGGRTLLVDADMRGPRQHEVFGIENERGLSGVLSGRAEEQVIQQLTSVPGLFLLPVGVSPPNPLELVERPTFGLLMREMTSKFDYVIVDTPAAAFGADATVIAAKCGAALVVARRNESRVGSLQSLVASLNDTHTNLAGVVVNDH